MTGLDRLRGYARRMDELHVWPGGAKLLDIADQIERERNVCDREEHEAASWVREHGGLERVKWLLDWCLSHDSKIEQLDFDYWLSGRVMHELGFEGDMADRDEVERRLLARLMPEGMEWLVEAWPRFKDDSPVRLLDDFERYGEENGVSAVTMYADGSFALNCRAYSKGERVNRPEPKVLDADGVEIREGDTVWHVETGEQCKVVEADLRSVSVDFRVDGDGTKHTGSILPTNLTHRAPVLAADGKPLREGETVWYCDVERTIDRIEHEGGNGSGAPNVFFTDGEWAYPTTLTHERPDSWKRLEDDANAAVCVYFGASVKDCENCDHNSWECSYDKTRDLVRRAKALAERERGE